MRIGMNQYVTISGVHPLWLTGLHAAVASEGARCIKDGQLQSVILQGVRWLERYGFYSVELECPLEYGEEKKSYRPYGKGLMAVFSALGLYGEKEQVLTGDLPPEFSGTTEVKLKITGVSPHRLSQFFTFCNGSRARSEYRQRFGMEEQELHEIVYAELTSAEWSTSFSTFTVQLRLTARQGFDGKKSILHTHPLGAENSCKSDSMAVLVAPRQVLESVYGILNVYWDIRGPSHYYDYE